MRSYAPALARKRQHVLAVTVVVIALMLALTVPALAAAPTVTSILPATCVNNVSNVNISNLAGTDFAAGATVKLTKMGQPDIAATNVALTGTTKITCRVNPLGAAAGAWDVVVTNTDAQSGTLPGGFTISNPAPTIPTLSPATTYAGGPDFTLSVTGSNYVTTSTVYWGGSPRPTTFVSPSSLTAQITAADIASAGTVPVTVVNPSPGGGTSSARTFTISNYPVPTISSLSQTSTYAGGPASR